MNNITATTDLRNIREALYNKAVDALKQVLCGGGYPYPEHTDTKAWADKYRDYTDIVSIMKRLTAREFLALPGLYGCVDGFEEAYYGEEAKELIDKYGTNEPLGDRVLELLDEVSNSFEPSWAVLMDFYAYFLVIAEYMAKTTGEPNHINDFRISIGISDFWKSA